MYADRFATLTLGGDSDVRRHLEVDVGIQRVPDRAVFFPGQRDGALNRLTGYGAVDLEMQIHFQQSMRVLLGSVPGQPRAERPYLLTPLSENEHHVGGHTAGERKHERLDR